MNSGIRTRKRRAWPAGLEQTSSGRFRWQPPARMRPMITAPIPAGGFPLESATLADAIAEVEAVYRTLAPLRIQRTLLDRVTVGPDTVADWVPRYLARVAARNVATETVARIRRAVEAFAAGHGHLPVSAIGTRHVADYLTGIASETMRAKARTALQDCFREANTQNADAFPFAIKQIALFFEPISSVKKGIFAQEESMSYEGMPQIRPA